MYSGSDSIPKFQVKFDSKFLLICSIVNILVFPLCVGLEIWSPIVGQGVWGSITFVVTGLLGFSASYKPKKPMIIATLVFSALSVCFAVISASITIERTSLRECSFYGIHYRLCYFRANPIMLTIANVVSLINNIIVTSLLSKVICKCCEPVVSSIRPIVVVHNPPANPQQPIPMWTISPTGQQQQFPSYPTTVYSQLQQEPMHPMQQQGQQWQNQQPSAPSRTLPRDNTDPTNLTNSPPPYTTLPHGASLERPLEKAS